MNLYNRSPGIDGWLPWFRNSILQSSVHPDTLQTTFYMILPFPLPCSGLEMKIGGKTGKDHRLRHGQFIENNGEIRQWTVTAVILMTECMVKEVYDSHMIAHTQQYPTAPFVTLHHPQGSLSPSLENDVGWYRITSASCHALSWLLQKLTLPWLESGP